MSTTSTGEGGSTQSSREIQSQIATYGSQIRDLLSNVKANVEQSKFSVEKIQNGIIVDIAFKATIDFSKEEGTGTSEISP